MDNLPIERSVDETITAGLLQLVQQQTGLAITPETTRIEIRSMICQIEAQMNNAILSGSLVDVHNEYVRKDHFADGIYARELHIPKGHVVVGKIHRFENLNFLSKGKATVITEEGGVEIVEAGIMMKSPIGVKRLLITHEDTVWTVLHNTKETDVDKIEEEVIVKNYLQLGWEDPLMLESKGE